MRNKIVAIIFVACSIGACSKSSSHTTTTTTTVNNNTLTEADAAAAISYAIMPATDGLAAQFITEGTIGVVNKPCSQTYARDTTITYASASGASPAYNYSVQWVFKSVCGISTLDGTSYSGTGTYSSASFNAKFNTSGTFSYTFSDSTYKTYGTTLSRSGTITVNTGNKVFNDTLNIVSTNIKYAAGTGQIASGTANVYGTLTGTANEKLNFNGTITFLGGGKATIVLNSGKVYNVAWP